MRLFQVRIFSWILIAILHGTNNKFVFTYQFDYIYIYIYMYVCVCVCVSKQLWILSRIQSN